MNAISARERPITIGITPLLAYFIGVLTAPLFRQLPWQQSDLVVLLHPPKFARN